MRASVAFLALTLMAPGSAWARGTSGGPDRPKATVSSGAPGTSKGTPGTSKGTPGTSKGTLKVTVTNFRNDKGLARVALFRTAQGFPGDAKAVFRHLAARIKKGVASVTFRDLPRGVLAATVIHDENGNNKMDTNWLGLPKEGIGASNNGTRRFGPPRFKKCRFKLTKRQQSISMRMRYYF